MKRTVLHIPFVLTALLLAGCRVEVPEIGNDAPKDVPIAFAFELPDAMPATKSLVPGNEPGVSTMQLVCFDKYGLYMATRTVTNTPNSYNAQVTTNVAADGTITGIVMSRVPEGTARIHYVANRSMPIPLSSSAGASERAVMLSDDLTTSYDEAAADGIVYWGYHREADADAMLEWMMPEGGASEDANQVLTLIDPSRLNKIWLIRDRARVSLNVPAGYTGTITWLAHNGRSAGYIAPYDASRSNPWDNYYKIDGGKYYANVTMNEYERCDRYSLYDESAGINREGEFVSSSSYLYLFDDDNEENSSGDNRVKIILKAVKGGVTKYFVVLVKDGDQGGDLVKVTRNSSYTIAPTVDLLDNSTVYYTSLKDAVNGTQYANAPVYIDRSITTVTDGTYELMIDLDENETTSVVFTDVDLDDTATHTKRIGFRFLLADGVTNAGASPEDFTVSWEDNDVENWTPTNAAFRTNNNVTWDSSAGKFYVTVNLGNTGEDAPYEDYLIIRHKATALTRYVHIYALMSFRAAEPTFAKEASQFGGRDVYRLSFKVPSNYNTDLYPIYVNIASSTLEPYSDDTMAARSGTFGVDVESTAVDGVVSSPTLSDWNYDARDWGFWYEYVILSAPPSRQVNIYLRDIRAAKPGQGATHVGLYLKMPYFGNAIAYSM